MHWTQAAIIAAGIAMLLLWRWLSLLIYPYGRCWLCRGKGRLIGSKPWRWNYCPACKGKPRRRRGAKKGKRS